MTKIDSKNHKKNSVIMTGGRKLSGTVNVQGSKNSVLPIISALTLIPEAEIFNVPDISDTYEMLEILSYLGAECTFKNGVIKYKRSNLENKKIENEFSERMRASSLFLGPLLAIYGESNVGMPGGCVIGSRPLNIHLEGFEALGSKVNLIDGNIKIKANKIEGTYTLPFPSVGATQNLIMASVFSKTRVTLKNIAIEPEVMELIEFLNKAGAKIIVQNSKTIKIKGVKKLGKIKFNIQPDRIEAFTLLVAAVATKGNIKILNCRPDDLSAPLQVLAKMGVEIKTTKNTIRAKYTGKIKGTTLETDVFPGFPTDCQQQLSILMLTAETPSIIKEKIFNNRLNHLNELRKMGADIEIEGNIAVINTSKLTGAKVNSFDLRGAASMIIAGLTTEDVSIINNLEYLYRGYESFIEKLNYLGADINYN